MIILRQCGIDLAEQIEDREGTVIYADPPYLTTTRVSGAYLHDFAPARGNSLFGESGGDHERLAAALGRFRRTRVVVSYYDSPDLDDLYPGWTKTVVTIAKNLANPSAEAGRVDAPEVLLTRAR